MGEETAEEAIKKRDPVPTLPTKVGNPDTPLPDDFRDLLKGEGTQDQQNSEFAEGSQNQPGLAPSDKARIQQDRINEQIQSEPPSDRDEIGAQAGNDPGETRSQIGEAIEDGLGRALDNQNGTPESGVGGGGAGWSGDDVSGADLSDGQGSSLPPRDDVRADDAFESMQDINADADFVRRATGDPIGTAGDMASDIAGDAFDTGSDLAGDAFDTASDMAGDAFDTGSDLAGDAFDTASDLAGDAFDTASDLAGDALDAVADTASDLFGE